MYTHYSPLLHTLHAASRQVQMGNIWVFVYLMSAIMFSMSSLETGVDGTFIFFPAWVSALELRDMCA